MDRMYVKDITDKVGKDVTLVGWVDTRRDHGKLIFIDLRDASGIAQLVFTPKNEEVYHVADSLRPEWVISISGIVQKRPKGMENTELETGLVEVPVTTLSIISRAKTPPIPLDTDGHDIEETLRLKYRYLDLRRSRLQKNIRLRHDAARFVRAYLSERGFIEIETPLLTKSTPEGARDFLVPSRLRPGMFYALPQSPQQYKQLLMAAGFERYFQLARCLRDEDLRADRTFEHTQIDLEMSFIEKKDVMEITESMVTALFEHFGKTITKKPFPVFTYQEALRQFGADKFDLREQKEDKNEMALAWVVDFPVFERDKETGAFTYSHNPFTAPRPEDEEKLLRGEAPETLTSLQYDLICNGYEIGGGGIRIHKPEMLERVFEILGHSKEDIQKKFGHMLEAFQYGMPPHGGIALGLDRILAILAGEDAIREVIAFPTTAGGQTAVMDAPSYVDSLQLKELGITIENGNDPVDEVKM